MEGEKVGSMEGIAVGELVGSIDGNVGANDGPLVGRVGEIEVGRTVGAPLGV